ncbi:hypothetical protein [Hymenobacter crusticola]|uniref:Outer membrane protein beta-barrel domain-containing protein n=1 Tax=Hymenobacter crusticola TaxID=1770526 RepID=A0A243WFI0_9BACT|nr:hypothetical protein [Hymenobacter crusticola]OUJ74503.1 hypothetical protein BXP70_06895 [Hymenobacter crusticola]
MRKWLLLSGLAILPLLGAPMAQAQRVLLQADVAQDTLPTSSGPNRTYFSHLYLGYAAAVGRASGPGVDLQFGRSGELQVGWRNKLRLHQALALGLDLRYARLGYYLKQNDQKTVPTATRYEREHITLSQLQGEAFVRLSAGRRGNAIGRYVDLLGWGGWVMGSSHYYLEAATATAKKRQVTERGLRYVQRWPYGVGLRLGSGRYAVTGRYRLSSTFAGAAQSRYPELPRWTVGLELGWF